MRRFAAFLLPLLVAACASSATTAPSLAPSATASPGATPSTTPAATELASPAPTDPPGPSPTLTAAPSETPLEPMPTVPPTFGSATLTTAGAPVPDSDLGGCGSLWLEASIYGTDDCGPHTFLLTAEPVVVAPGATMTFTPPAGYELSIDRIAGSPDAAGIHSWSVSIALVSDLAALPDGQQEGITADHGGRVLGYGDRAVVSAWVKAPTMRGEYLVQLDAAVNRGPWTFTWPRFFWRVSVR